MTISDLVAISDLVEGEFVRDVGAVWRLANHKSFGYSDGNASEKYLRKVFSSAKDLSTTSDELELAIKDWPSEYHLTKKRAQLLDTLHFPKSARVLEVGCGCGAITRHLCERFDNVVSIEGSIARAEIAAMRVADTKRSTIICAPFQDVKFKQKFDLIYCIGVFEYSGAFIRAEDPYRAALDYFSSLLAPDGVLIIAIENQFGMKYWNGAHEDHLGTIYEGIEGYHGHPEGARTFGKRELDDMLRVDFKDIRFLYPYPDYKIPDCVLDESFVQGPDAGEIIGQMVSRDYARPMRPKWNEYLTSIELAKNHHLDFFANSFLILAGKSALPKAVFPVKGAIYSSGRKKEYSTRTEIISGENGDLLVRKVRAAHPQKDDPKLTMTEPGGAWISAPSLHTQLLAAAQAKRKMEDVLLLCKPWVDRLNSEATTDAAGVKFLPGDYLDCNWRNAYVVDSGCEFIDKEWVWHKAVRLRAVLIRAVFDFLSLTEKFNPRAFAALPDQGKQAIRVICALLGEPVDDADFAQFMTLETHLAKIASDISETRTANRIRLFFISRRLRRFLRHYLPLTRALKARIISKAQALLLR
jgi:SAM-dependent methyltransferase